VRLADQPSVEVDVFVAASPEVVWALVADVTRIGDWSPECIWARWIDGSGPVPGARFLGQQRRGDAEWRSVSVVTEAEPGRSFAWVVGDPVVPAATWRFDLSPEAGGTRLVQRAVMGLGSSRMNAVIAEHPDHEERIVAARLEEHRRNMAVTLDGIRQAAEREAAEAPG
jgi:Polyketide cyclase / dehydrase and lipid transport